MKSLDRKFLTTFILAAMQLIPTTVASSGGILTEYGYQGTAGGAPDIAQKLHNESEIDPDSKQGEVTARIYAASEEGTDKLAETLKKQLKTERVDKATSHTMAHEIAVKLSSLKRTKPFLFWGAILAVAMFASYGSLRLAYKKFFSGSNQNLQEEDPQDPSITQNNGSDSKKDKPGTPEGNKPPKMKPKQKPKRRSSPKITPKITPIIPQPPTQAPLPSQLLPGTFNRGSRAAPAPKTTKSSRSPTIQPSLPPSIGDGQSDTPSGSNVPLADFVKQVLEDSGSDSELAENVASLLEKSPAVVLLKQSKNREKLENLLVSLSFEAQDDKEFNTILSLLFSKLDGHSHAPRIFFNTLFNSDGNFRADLLVALHRGSVLDRFIDSAVRLSDGYPTKDIIEVVDSQLPYDENDAINFAKASTEVLKTLERRGEGTPEGMEEYECSDKCKKLLTGAIRLVEKLNLGSTSKYLTDALFGKNKVLSSLVAGGADDEEIIGLIKRINDDGKLDEVLDLLKTSNLENIDRSTLETAYQILSHKNFPTDVAAEVLKNETIRNMEQSLRAQAISEVFDNRGTISSLEPEEIAERVRSVALDTMLGSTSVTNDENNPSQRTTQSQIHSSSTSSDQRLLEAVQSALGQNTGLQAYINDVHAVLSRLATRSNSNFAIKTGLPVATKLLFGIQQELPTLSEGTHSIQQVVNAVLPIVALEPPQADVQNPKLELFGNDVREKYATALQNWRSSNETPEVIRAYLKKIDDTNKSELKISPLSDMVRLVVMDDLLNEEEARDLLAQILVTGSADDISDKTANLVRTATSISDFQRAAAEIFTALKSSNDFGLLDNPATDRHAPDRHEPAGHTRDTYP